MDSKGFGTLVAGMISSLIGVATAGCEKKVSPANSASSPSESSAFVNCYSRSCAGKFEYKGQMNKCGGMMYAMSVPESVCNPNKGLKTIE